MLHVAFVLTGVMTTLLGPILPFLSARWELNDSQSGSLFTVQFLSNLLGVAFATFVTRQQKYRSALMLGAGFMAAGAVLLAHASLVLGISAIAIYGIGLGSIIPAANLLIAELNPDRRAAALNLLNFSWGIGAVGSPIIIRALHSLGLYLYVMGAILAVSAATMVWVPAPIEPRKEPNSDNVSPQSAVPWLSRLVFILGILFFCYVGTENAVAGWIASYAKRLGTESSHLWTMMPSFFWGALLCGRALAPLLLRHMRETSLSTLGLSLAVTGVAVLLGTRSMVLIGIAAAVSGLGLSSIYPAYIAMLSHWFGAAGVRVGGLMFALGSVGGASLPWLVGLLSTHFSSLRAGLVVPLASSMLMLALYLAFGSYRPTAVERSKGAANT